MFLSLTIVMQIYHTYMHIHFLYKLLFVKQMIVAEYSVCWLAVARQRYFNFCTCRKPKSFAEGKDALATMFFNHLLHCYRRKSRDNNFYPIIYTIPVGCKCAKWSISANLGPSLNILATFQNKSKFTKEKIRR